MRAAMTPASRDRIAYLFGSDRQPGLVTRGRGQVLSHGSTNIWRLRSRPRDFVRLHVPPNFGRSAIRHDLDKVGLILNLVTDADLNPKVTDIAHRFLRG